VSATPARVVACTPECFTVYNAGALDPVLVILQDFGAGRGRLTLECYGRAWSAYWGAMGDDSLRDFLLNVSPEYIVTNLLRPLDLSQRRRATEEKYLTRIVRAARTGLSMTPEDVAP
jgi:hypothetical protein